ncbi:hypothetical protein [Schaedlerella arabinosiphila]|uniref:hypothetical protein n=1 Tax=Schaedlerella arabinosiphila TaxID=2044587 RepID=UPI002557DCC9|nr:hypothetical protein [Schaedlerella arabinosiphila]
MGVTLQPMEQNGHGSRVDHRSYDSQPLYNLKDAAKMLNFLQANSIMDIQGKLKPVERRRKIISKA